MKELSIEEKAKAYDEAIERGKRIQNTPYTAHWDIMKEVAEHLLPALKESEDERIRLKLIEAVKRDMVVGGTNDKQLAIAWLEKQGKQEPVKLSEEDETIKTIKCALLSCCKGSLLNYELSYDGYEKCLSWLKSIRPQNTWKPSDEQMKALDDALSLAKNCGEEGAFDLRTLYEQLKKLMEE